jgi:hypothetical protein
MRYGEVVTALLGLALLSACTSVAAPAPPSPLTEADIAATVAPRRTALAIADLTAIAKPAATSTSAPVRQPANTAPPAQAASTVCRDAVTKVQTTRVPAGFTVQDALDTFMLLERGSHTVQVDGWSGTSANGCTVVFAYRRDGQPTRFTWTVDARTGAISPTDPLARQLMGRS